MATTYQLTEEELLESLENFYDCFHELFEFMREHQNTESLNDSQQLEYDAKNYRSMVFGTKLQAMLVELLKMQSNVTLGVDCTEYTRFDHGTLKEAKFKELLGVMNRYRSHILSNANILDVSLDEEDLESPPKEKVLKKAREEHVKTGDKSER